MDRRGFFKILSATSAGALAAGCGHKSDALIPMLVKEDELVPGQEEWRPAVCTACAAGCGTIVRIMEGTRTIQRNGETWHERIAAVKKVEGNPLDPVSGGRLCARGQATVQGLYHPARLRGPVKRTGERGKTQFAPISWDEAISSAAQALAKAARARIAIFAGPETGSRSRALESFAQALGSPAPAVCSLTGGAVERKAAEDVFGWKGLPVYDLAHARAVVGVGADFLGGWVSPVWYARQFGQFRQGRPGVRGLFQHAESRLSTTAAASDRWLPLRPGTEPHFLAALGRLLLDAGAARNHEAAPVFASADVHALLTICGLEERRARQAAQMLAESDAPLVLAGASVVHANSLEAVTLSHHLNWMLGNIGKPGGVLPPAAESPARSYRASEALANAQAVILAGGNPAATLPGGAASLGRAETIISFAGHVDESTAHADLILPDHHALESELAGLPAVVSRAGAAVAVPFIRPLYDTRAAERSLADIAGKLGAKYEPAGLKDFLPKEANFDDALRDGGWWAGAPQPDAKAVPSKLPAAPVLEASAAPVGDLPFAFQAYPSVQFHDGSGSHLPWLQELPDPASSSIWGLPVEIDPQTAQHLGIANGDVVRVESPHGALEAPVYIHPGAIPGVVSMALGDGKSNPVSVLAPAFDSATGVPLTGGTRVKLARVGPRRDWIQFAAPDREERGFDHR